MNGNIALIRRVILSSGAVGNFYTILNDKGDVVGLRNYVGTVLARYNYDSWGKLISITDGNDTPLADGSFAHQMAIRYRGYYYDTETGLYYLQSRYYDPEAGRFLNADGVGYIGASGTSTSYNAFEYCENNPINYFDWDGKVSASTILSLLSLTTTTIYNNFLCVRLYLWGFTHYKKNQTYDFSEKWKELLIYRLKKSKGMLEAIKHGKELLKNSSSNTCYAFNWAVDFYKYKKSISDIDLILSIGGGGTFRIEIKPTKQSKNNKRVYAVTVKLIKEVFDFGYWKMRMGKMDFGNDEPHSKNALVTLINNFGYLTQRVGAFTEYTWEFTVSYFA